MEIQDKRYLKIIENKDKLIKFIEEDIIEEDNEDKINERDFSYKGSFTSNLCLNIYHKKHKNWTIDELRDILYWYYELDIIDDDSEKEYNFFNLIREVYDNYEDPFEFKFLMGTCYDSFIYNVLEDVMWKRTFKNKLVEWLKNH